MKHPVDRMFHKDQYTDLNLPYELRYIRVIPKK